MNIEQITQFHQERIVTWKKSGVTLLQKNNNDEFLKYLEANHAFNFMLWDAEDKARRDDLGFEFVYRAKREIDNYNQQRNNCVEAIDERLFVLLNPSIDLDCPIHSETPGMIIDRLSILSLKQYHMKTQTEREEVTHEHRRNCEAKLKIIHQQLLQIQDCLNNLCSEIKQKTRTFKIYRQFKMYNDPNLNPELYLNKDS